MLGELYILEKPPITKSPFDTVKAIIDKNSSSITDIFKTAQSASYPKYLYWDKVKYKNLPKNIDSHESLWQIIKFWRTTQSIKTSLKLETGEYFSWVKLTRLEEFFHQLDLNTGGHLSLFAHDIDEKTRLRFVANGIMEESIASSQLEGANTTRKLAKQFLREGRRPKNKAEQMILNNYEAMSHIENELKTKNLDRDTLLELHSILTKNTMSDGDTGRFRNDEDEIIVGDENGMVYHIPPKEDFLLSQIEPFLKFCNDQDSEETFYHPVIKAILIHFWVGYLHPFVDGNGRLARGLFYWYLLKKGYWAFAYLPISMAIKKSPEQYNMAYIYSEQDGSDVTYFIDYNIRKIQQALENFKEYTQKKESEAKTLRKIASGSYHFNERQIKLLQHFYKNPDAKTFPRIHANTYQISWLTASTDLKKLEVAGFIISKKEGINRAYYSTEKINTLF